MTSTTAQSSERGDARDEPPPDAERDEAPQERLDRNQTELMTELRVAGAGVQILFGFLLIVPFNTRWTALSSFDRDVYFVALLCVAIAAVLLIAPMVMVPRLGTSNVVPGAFLMVSFSTPSAK